MPANTITLYCGVNPFSPKLKNLVRDIRPQWVLEELKLPYIRKRVDFSKREHKTPEYLKLNPFGKIPALTQSGLSVFESGAICLHLAESHEGLIEPARPDATPEQQQTRAQTLAWIFAMTTTIEPQIMRVFSADVLFADDDYNKKVKENTMKFLVGQLKAIDDHLSSRTYMVGDTFSLADIITTCVMMFGKPNGLLDSFPSLSKYYDRMTSRPACKKAMADNTE